jgi:hypothetical protein
MKELKWVLDDISIDRRFENSNITAKLHLDNEGHLSVSEISSMCTDLQRRLDEFNYIDTDIMSTREVASLYPKMFMQLGRCNGKTAADWAFKNVMNSIFGKKKYGIKDVIFNDPATIVLWEDGTKTVVKTQDGDEYDPEKGLAMAISKKALGNKHEYYNVFKKWLKKYEKQQKADADTSSDLSAAWHRAAETLRELNEALSGKTPNKPTTKL